jgi:hypothetical protein
MYYRISKKPGNITSWGPLKKVRANTKGQHGYTYPNPQFLSKEKQLYLFWRGGNAMPTFSTTRNLKYWSKAQTLIKAGEYTRPYIKIESNGKDTIHFAFTDGHPDENQTSIYYSYYKKGSFYKADGTSLGSRQNLPIDFNNADKIYDAAANSGVRAWVHDVAYDSTGKPIIVFTTFPSPNNHRYYYARFNGKTWISKEISGAGGSFSAPPAEPKYSGGIVLDHEDPSTVFLSRQIGKFFQIEKWYTTDKGNSWSSERLTHTRTKNVRPFATRGIKSGDMGLIWMSGTYKHFRKYSTSLRAIFRRKSKNQPPQALFRASDIKGKAPMKVIFNAKPSRDKDGRIVRYRWSFRDKTPRIVGPTKLEHTFTKRGRFFVILDVTDNKGKRAQYGREIIVQ